MSGLKTVVAPHGSESAMDPLYLQVSPPAPGSAAPAKTVKPAAVYTVLAVSRVSKVQRMLLVGLAGAPAGLRDILKVAREMLPFAALAANAQDSHTYRYIN